MGGSGRNSPTYGFHTYYPGLLPAENDFAAVPASDERSVGPPHTLDTPRTFPHLTDLADWQAHRERLRQQALVACGLAPLPPKTPLKAKIFGRVARDGYSIEKVYFQTYPGFYLAGNLYRPLRNQAEHSAATHP